MNRIRVYNSIISFVAFAALCGGVSSCIENDIPYARIEAGFTSMVAEGETSAATIDSNNRVVTLTLGESVSLDAVDITSYELTEGATISNDITGGIDLTDNYKVTVSLYQDYEWIIKANQSIERYFSVPGQVGTSVVDAVGKRVVVYMPEDADITAVAIGDVKLGPAGITTMSPDLNNSVADLSKPVEVAVTYNGKTEVWTVYVEVTSTLVSLDRVDAWTNVMWLYGSAQEGYENGFEYRLQGSEDWIRIDQSEITHAGGEFSTCVPHLDQNTSYEVRAYSGANYSPVTTVMTQGIIELPNMGFDTWWYENDKIWNPWDEGGTSFWDTGNDGAASFAVIGVGGSNTTPDTDTWDGGQGYSVKLASKWIVVKLAGGNIFAGSYVRTDGTNGVLSFGREFTGRPTRLRGHWKYISSTINRVGEEALADLEGRPDTAIVYTALINKPEPVEIRTDPSNRQLFDRNADYVIAYGEVQTGETIGNWTDFDIEYEYRRTDLVPNYIVIVSTSSKYADYFTGGDGSTLWLDDLSLGWDY